MLNMFAQNISTHILDEMFLDGRCLDVNITAKFNNLWMIMSQTSYTFCNLCKVYVIANSFIIE